LHSDVIVERLKKKPDFLHPIFGAIITGYLLLLFLLYRVNTAIVVSVATFDFLFVSLIFPLKGSIFHKVILLLTGNLAGFIWNLLQFQLADVIAYFLGGAFSIVFSIASLILNYIWIVSFWSLALSILTRKNLRKEEPTNS
jgi:hypothetical protein